MCPFTPGWQPLQKNICYPCRRPPTPAVHAPLPCLPCVQPLQKKIRYLATIRNKLVHERDFHHIPVSQTLLLPSGAWRCLLLLLPPPLLLLRLLLLLLPPGVGGRAVLCTNWACCLGCLCTSATVTTSPVPSPAAAWWSPLLLPAAAWRCLPGGACLLLPLPPLAMVKLAACCSC